MSANINKLTGGPAQVQVDDVQVSHTQGGVSCTIAPQTHMSTVDQFGVSPIDVWHTGDDVRITVPWAQWDAAVLDEVYAAGLDGLTSSSGVEFKGIGRSAGFRYAERDLKIIPFVTSENGKKVQFFRTTPVGSIELNFDPENDRILETEYVAMPDPDNEADGAMIGKLFPG